MRCLAHLAALAAVATAASQNLPQLQKPVPIDMHVAALEWHPKGRGMIYTRKEGAGRALGVFMLGQEQGKSLVQIGKDDRYDITWFAGKPNALVTVFRPEAETGEKRTRIEVVLVDLENQTQRSIFNRRFEEKEKASLEVDASPSLLHAILTLNTTAGRKHFILKTGSFDIIPSVDLDKAAEQGTSGPNWSVDGTAVYSNAAGSVLKSGTLEIANGAITIAEEDARAKEKFARAALVTQSLEIKLLEANLMEKTALRLRFTPPPPAVGATVLELMPQNATLRQVRFKGPWNEAYPRLTPIASQNIPVLLNFGRSKGQTNSVWLTQAKQQAETGVLVTPYASQAWIAPMHTSVAYLTDGVLFIRVIGPG